MTLGFRKNADFFWKKTLCDGATTSGTTTLSILTRLNNNCAIMSSVIMMSVFQLRTVIQSVIMPSIINMIVIMTRVRKLRAIIRSVIMPSVIKMIVIMIRVRKLRAIIRSVIV
jgi:hypothetical protein